ncbi:MAG: hypothetical protein ACJASG_002248 [Oleiphilaceae bacterium]|jgi:hypothetical protein
MLKVFKFKKVMAQPELTAKSEPIIEAPLTGTDSA